MGKKKQVRPPRGANFGEVRFSGAHGTSWFAPFVATLSDDQIDEIREERAEIYVPDVYGREYEVTGMEVTCANGREVALTSNQGKQIYALIEKLKIEKADVDNEALLNDTQSHELFHAALKVCVDSDQKHKKKRHR
jgi:hypothetical protein